MVIHHESRDKPRAESSCGEADTGDGRGKTRWTLNGNSFVLLPGAPIARGGHVCSRMGLHGYILHFCLGAKEIKTMASITKQPTERDAILSSDGANLDVAPPTFPHTAALSHTELKETPMFTKAISLLCIPSCICSW